MARAFARELSRLMENKAQNEPEIRLQDGTTVILDGADYTRENLDNKIFAANKPDNEILAVALYYKNKTESGQSVVLLTEDMILTVKAQFFGVNARSVEIPHVRQLNESYTQLKDAEISDEEMSRFLELGFLQQPERFGVRPNQFVRFHSPTYPASDDTVGRYVFSRSADTPHKIVRLADYNETSPDLFGFGARNLEQRMFLDVLLDPNISIVIGSAKAGTGKTFLSVLSAKKLLESDKFDRVLVSRPTVFMGRNDPGALPGGIDEKYSEWKQPYLDNIQAINKRGAQPGSKQLRLQARLPERWEILPFEFMRGRSISDSLIIVDEFQNTNGHEAKTILTRIGENSKLILMGDVGQIDVPPTFLNKWNNGLALSMAAFTNPSLSDEELSHVAVVELFEGVRSAAAELSSRAFDMATPNH
ncbi:MAG: hypothetical protein HC902_14355 [Calothrix sp. SM1_5_4]|nr:hypothetical protein [Calothrix sp. SM1_5_4]